MSGAAVTRERVRMPEAGGPAVLGAPVGGSRPIPTRASRRAVAGDDLETLVARVEATGTCRVLRRIREDAPNAGDDVDPLARLVMTVHGRGPGDDLSAVLFAISGNGLGRPVATLDIAATDAPAQRFLPFQPPGVGRASRPTEHGPDALRAFAPRIEFAASHEPWVRSRLAALRPDMADLPWACLRDVDFQGLGTEGPGLAAILSGLGLYADIDRPVVGCLAMAEILSAARWEDAVRDPPFVRLRRQLEQRRVRLLATGPTYGIRDLLKTRGWRWSDGTRGGERGWVLVLPLSSATVEAAWVRERLHPVGGAVVLRELA